MADDLASSPGREQLGMYALGLVFIALVPAGFLAVFATLLALLRASIEHPAGAGDP